MSMYCKEMIKIGKAANGFIIEVCVPLKKPEKKTGSDCCCPSGIGEGELQFVAKDEAGVAEKIKELLPKLDGEYSSEKEFEKAFNDAIDTE